LGKALLAYLSEEEKKILKQKEFLRFTEKTITDGKELEKELSKIKNGPYLR